MSPHFRSGGCTQAITLPAASRLPISRKRFARQVPWRNFGGANPFPFDRARRYQGKLGDEFQCMALFFRAIVANMLDPEDAALLSVARHDDMVEHG